jgi:hypothetical protein
MVTTAFVAALLGSARRDAANDGSRATTRLLTGLGEHVPSAVPLSTERARSYFILNSCDRTIVSADARMANDEERDLLDLGPATCSDDAALLQLPAH